MRYMCLVYNNEMEMANATQVEIEKVVAANVKFEADMRRSGVLLHSEAMQPTMTATTVQVKHGKVHTTDGPFAETKEQLGGFYLIEAKDLDEAISVAAQIPCATENEKIEVRPVVDFSAMQA